VRASALLLFVSTALAQYGAPRVIATVNVPNLNESSGIAASRRHPGVFWSHNDSGGGPWIYAFDHAGKSLGRWTVPGARASDWEDITIGPGPKKDASYLYIGDIGDNNSGRKFVTVYRIPEPAELNGGTGKTAAAESIRLEYPDRAHDAEALLIHPKSGDLYIVTKARGEDRDTRVYKASAPLNTKAKTRLKQVATLDLPNTSVFTLLIGRITGGDISPDGTRVAVCDYLKAWEAVLPAGARNFDAIWSAKWRDIGIGQRAQGEGIAYRHDGKALLVTSEGKPFPLIEIEREQPTGGKR
jgi:hypothetical protein